VADPVKDIGVHMYNQLNKENKSISVADPVKDIGVHMYNQLNKENKAI